MERGGKRHKKAAVARLDGRQGDVRDAAFQSVARGERFDESDTDFHFHSGIFVACWLLGGEKDILFSTFLRKLVTSTPGEICLYI